jgi:GMP synthase (glutamine-hydrolysing)
MRRLCVIKTGHTIPALNQKRGDFEDWILSGMGFRNEDVIIAEVCGDGDLPAYDEITGVVITGSHAMVTEGHDWIEQAAEWLRGSIENRVPVLGICFGHQLLAHALGGEVGDNPNGHEYGTIEVHLEKKANSDPLLGGFPSPIRVQASHTQSVLEPPHGATRLASSTGDPNQSFMVGGRAWGVQFHPEFDAEIMTAYIEYNKDILIGENQDPLRLIGQTADTRYGREILKRFAGLAGNDQLAGKQGTQ